MPRAFHTRAIPKRASTGSSPDRGRTAARPGVPARHPGVVEEPRERVDHAVEELDEAVAEAEAELAAAGRGGRRIAAPAPDGDEASTRPPAADA